MPRIRDEILDSVFYLYPTADAAKSGESAGGTGFLVAIPSATQPEFFVHIYAVTNSHVIREGNSPFIRLNTIEGASAIWHLEGMEWVHHPDADDVAVCRIPFISPEFRAKCIPRSMFLSQELVDKFSIGPGDDVFLVGRLVNHEGKQRNLPSVRFGNISMMPLEPIRNSRGLLQESFLIEARSIGGYSGSPVFVHIPPFAHRDGPGNMMPGTLGPWLIGINWGHIHMYEPVLDQDLLPVPERLKVKANTGMLGVVPSWRITEVLDLPELLKKREDIDARMPEHKFVKVDPEQAQS